MAGEVAACVDHQPLRVMHLLLKLGFGGAEGGVVKLVNGFDRARVTPSICSCWPADPIKDQLRSDVRLFEMNRRRQGNDPGFVMKLQRLLRRERPDVLHTHGWATLCEGVIAGRMASVPVIVHGEHGTMETRRWNLRLQRFVWNRLDGVLSVSSRLTTKLADTVGFPASRIVTIRNGVDTHRFTPDRRAMARSAFGFSATDIVIGTVGRLLPVKDQQTFVSALGDLVRQGVRFKAVIGGDGPLLQQLNEHAKGLGLDERLIFLGTRPDVEDVLACLDVFVLSSVSEGLSNTILEAMATGLPVVATDVGGTDELVTHGVSGLLVPSGDHEALAGAIAKFISDPALRQTMGRAGRVRAEADFDLSRMIRNYEDLYMDLARPREQLHLNDRARMELSR